LVKSASAESEATLTRHFQCDDEEGYCSDATPIKPQLFTEQFLTAEKVI
jgi:hypothetical protein